MQTRMASETVGQRAEKILDVAFNGLQTDVVIPASSGNPFQHLFRSDFPALFGYVLGREPSDDRTGVFTSGIVSTKQAQKIALYFTGRQ